MASAPTSARSEVSACWRSASICAFAASVSAPRLGLGLRAHLGDDLGALFPGLLAQPRGLVPGLGELLPVLLEDPGRLRLGLFRPFEAAFDLVGALLQRLLDPRQCDLAEQAEDDEERDRPDDELGERGDQRVL